MKAGASKPKRRLTRRPSSSTESPPSTQAQEPPTQAQEDVDPATEPMTRAFRGGREFEDNRPTEVYAPRNLPELHQTRDQVITGRTIREMLANQEHRLKQALETLISRARSDLPTLEIDARASLLLRHEFEFNRRVGYKLTLRLFDNQDRSVEVSADLDHDGRAVRRASMMSKLISI